MSVIAISYGETHEIHKKWFEDLENFLTFSMPNGSSVSNLYRYFRNAREIGEADLIICEDHFSIRTGLAYKLQNPNTKVVRLVADEGYYNCIEGKKSDVEENFLHRFLDGAIAVSPLAREWAKNYIKGEIEVVRPYIPDLDSLLTLEPDYSSDRVVFVGYNNPNKNIDSLVEAVSMVQDLELEIIGKGHKEYDSDSVRTLGYVEDLEAHLESASMYVQPSKGDTFPVASLEGMAAGLTTIVTESCGTKEIVEKTDERLVCKENPESIAESLNYLKQMNQEEKKKIGNKLRNEVRKLHKTSSQKRFSEALETWE